MNKKFSENVAGQKYPKERLFKIWQSKAIPHAFIFSGTQGIGKHFTAINFIKLINNAVSDDSIIGKKIETLQEPYVKYIFPQPGSKSESAENESKDKKEKKASDEFREQLDKKIKNPYHKIKFEKSGTIKIAAIREIKKFASLSFDDLNYRVVLISEAELMFEEAQNALLKSLEEPPPGVIFILLTNNLNKLLPTIKSRCCLINFEPLKVEDISKILQKYFEVDQKTAKQVSRFSAGSVTNAIELIENDFKFFLEKTISILRYSLALKIHSAIKEIQPVLKDGNPASIRLLIEMISIWLADTQRNKAQIDDIHFEDYKETIEKFNLRFKDADVQKILNKINYLGSIIDNNINLNIISLNIIFELASLREKGV